MLRRGLVSVVLALVAGSASLSAPTVTARPLSYGIAATRTCLTKHGAVFGAASDPAVAALPAAQRRKVLDGLLPPGTVHLFLVIGTTAATRSRSEPGLSRRSSSSRPRRTLGPAG